MVQCTIVSWIVNESSHFLPDLTNGLLPKLRGNATNIIIDIPVNNTECVCIATLNQHIVYSDPAYIYLATYIAS